MSDAQAVLVRRPRRWDAPLDPTMTDADAHWLRTRNPFAAMRDSTFTAAMPLHGILRNDCRIRRFQSGEIVTRQGDYGNSAYLVLSGSVRVSLDALSPEQVGRDQPRRMRWREAVAQLWNRPRVIEGRDPREVTAEGATRIDTVDDRPAIFLQDFPAVLRGRRTLAMGPGELFGEVAAMYRSPQTATVIAEEEATLVEIRWQGLRLLRRDKSFSDQLEKHYRAHWLVAHLRETPLLRFLPEATIDRVAAATELRSFGRMEWNAEFKRIRKLPTPEQIRQEPLIASEGDHPTDLVLIRAGFARVSQHHGAGDRTTAYLGKGHLFGLSEIVANARRPGATSPIPLQHSLRAIGFVDTLHIPIEIVAEHLLPYIRANEVSPVRVPPQSPTTPSPPDAPAPPLDGSVPSPQASGPAAPSDAPHDRRATRREKPGEELGSGVVEPAKLSATKSTSLSTGMLEFLVQQRLTNGRQTLVIDLERCTRCDDCVRACATTHGGNPRMARSGPRHDRLQFAQACMHCVDPVCMIGCPTGAIARDEATGTVHISEPICIGCGACAAACPYENIQMVEIRDLAGRGFRDAATGMPILKATKCDLCQRQPSGPACQAACPHDALVRIDLSEPGPLDQWLGRRTL